MKKISQLRIITLNIYWPSNSTFHLRTLRQNYTSHNRTKKKDNKCVSLDKSFSSSRENVCRGWHTIAQSLSDWLSLNFMTNRVKKMPGTFPSLVSMILHSPVSLSIFPIDVPISIIFSMKQDSHHPAFWCFLLCFKNGLFIQIIKWTLFITKF